MKKVLGFSLLAGLLAISTAQHCYAQGVGFSGATSGNAATGAPTNNTQYQSMNEQNPASWGWYQEAPNQSANGGYAIYNPNWGGQAPSGQTLGGPGQHSKSNGYYNQLQGNGARTGHLEVQTGLMAPYSVSGKGFQDGFTLGFHGSTMTNPNNGAYGWMGTTQDSHMMYPGMPPTGTGSVNVDIGSGY